MNRQVLVTGAAGLNGAFLSVRAQCARLFQALLDPGDGAPLFHGLQSDGPARHGLIQVRRTPCSGSSWGRECCPPATTSGRAVSPRPRSLVSLPMQPSDVPVTYADTSALERDTGYRPSTPLEAGLREFAKWYKYYYFAERCRRI